MKKVFSLMLALILPLVLILPMATVVLAAPMPGAIWTTDVYGNPVNQNMYEYKWDVYLNGGPHSSGSPGLPDGDYYVQVTSPNGVLLGSSVFGPVLKPVHVINGSFARLQLWMIVYQAPGANGYADTPNAGHEYKVWISSDPTFPNNASKTDNFKVLNGCYYSSIR